MLLAPYQPSSGEGSRGVAAARPMVAPEPAQDCGLGVFLPEEEEGERPQQAPGIRGWVALSRIPPTAAAQCEVWL